jgi:hypothetical protein
MLVPGVLQGSKGPLLYPADEVRKSPDDWNHIPIVVYHPMKDGKPVSARSPSILSKYGVGFVFHSRTDSKGVLKGEGWLDVEATRRVDKSVLDSVQLGKPIELSTGLFVDDEPAPEGAIFNDHRGTRKYVGIARNYKPDHLAILPSGKGACSLADGCGVLINEAAMEAYQVIVNELEAEAVSLYFPDLELDLLTANKFNPNQPRDKAGRFATVGQATKAVEKAQGRVAKAQAALDKAKATLKVEKSGLLTAKKGLSEAKAREKAKSPAASKAIEKAKASTETAARGRGTKTADAGSNRKATVKSTTPKASKPPSSTSTSPKTVAATSPHGFQSRTPEEHHAVYQDLMRQGMAGKETKGAKGLTSWDPKLSDKEFASRVNSFGEHLNKVANKDHVNKVLGQLGLAPRSKKAGIAFLKTLLKENRYGFLRAYE